MYEEVEVYSFADALFGDLNDLHEAQNIIVKHLESRRYSIAFLFVHIHNAPPRKTWYDKDGVVTKIKVALCIPTGTCIKKVLEDVMLCCERGIQYAPKMLSGRGRKALILPKSEEERTIAHLVESGCSIGFTTQLLNRGNTPQNQFSVSSVYTCIKRLKPKVSKIKKRQQGRVDKASPWAKARLGWASQLLTRMGEEVPNLDTSKDYFDRSKLSCLAISQIVFWDETHTKCIIGDAAGRDFVYVFPRDANGELDANGTYSETSFQRLNVKYDNEVRLSLGCAAVLPNDQEELVGKRCLPFHYTGKRLLGIPEYRKRVLDEIQRAKGLEKGDFVPNKQVDENFYPENLVTRLNGIGDAKQRDLAKIGIYTLQDFIDAEGSIDNRLRLCPSIKMSASFLEKKSTEAKNSCARERE